MSRTGFTLLAMMMCGCLFGSASFADQTGQHSSGTNLVDSSGKLVSSGAVASATNESTRTLTKDSKAKTNGSKTTDAAQGNDTPADAKKPNAAGNASPQQAPAQASASNTAGGNTPANSHASSTPAANGAGNSAHKPAIYEGLKRMDLVNSGNAGSRRGPGPGKVGGAAKRPASINGTSIKLMH